MDDRRSIQSLHHTFILLPLFLCDGLTKGGGGRGVVVCLERNECILKPVYFESFSNNSLLYQTLL